MNNCFSSNSTLTKKEWLKKMENNPIAFFARLQKKISSKDFREREIIKHHDFLKTYKEKDNHKEHLKIQAAIK